MEIHNGAQSLRWLVWPEIDDELNKRFTTECPRIVVNPNPSHLNLEGMQVPKAALPDIALDETTVKGFDFRLCEDSEVTGLVATSALCTTRLSVAENSVTACSGVVPQVTLTRVKQRRQHARHEQSENLVEEPMHSQLGSDNGKELNLGDEEFFEPVIPAKLEQ
ncbi:hypothetical protein F0562_018880 [Nyssa sinensis]|uniref:Uncharacterized protein n=1 Tax=Nyssa sinensis TaxID=561372 RepID=A0A5J4ZC89_9ASTE|nr:hypothetical protein F0562_018880 [Nyssa sinensis]